MWAEFVSHLNLKTTRRLNFVWVKGHATKIRIDSGITATLDGAQASAAAAHHAAPLTLTEAATQRQWVALTTHAFVAETLFKQRVDLLAMSEADHG